MSTTTTTPNVIQTIENDLSVAWQDVISFFNNAEQDIQNFLAQVASGGQVLETDITNVLSAISGKLSTLNGLVPIIESALNIIAPGSSAVTTIIADITTGITDVGEIIAGVAAGAPPSGADAIVTDVVTAITKLFGLVTLAGQASTQVSQLTAASPSATQTTSQPTPAEG